MNNEKKRLDIEEFCLAHYDIDHHVMIELSLCYFNQISEIPITYYDHLLILDYLYMEIMAQAEVLYGS